MSSALCCEPVFGQELLARADPGRAIFDGDTQQQRILRHMKDAIAALSKHDDQVPALLLELTSPALPADGLSPTLLLLALQPVRRRQGEHQQGEQDVDTHCPGGFLGGMLQAPLLFTLFDTAVLDQTTVVIVIERLQRFCNRGIRQEDGFAPGSIVPIIPRGEQPSFWTQGNACLF
jgi:hypothetical protein